MRAWGVSATCPGFRSPLIGGNRLFYIPRASKLQFFGTKMFAETSCCSVRIWTCNKRWSNMKIQASGNSNESRAPIAPVTCESPTGQLLSMLLQSHPHLLPATVDQQLQRLQSERNVQKYDGSSENLLYRRIAEVKEKERQRALEEIIYCLVVHKFMENNIAMVPALLPSSDPLEHFSTLPDQGEKLESVHSPDAAEMIQSHLTLILGERMVGPLNTIVQINKIKLGKLYAASIMYGYFLKRVDERFQLERKMKTLPSSPKRVSLFEDFKPNPFWDLESMVQIYPDDDEVYEANGDEAKPYKLRSYVGYLDAETLQQYATMRSKEAISIIERQTQALFGRPDIQVAGDGSLNALNDEVITVTFSGLTMLVMEAAAFGTFLWEAEGYVESNYHFLKS